MKNTLSLLVFLALAGASQGEQVITYSSTDFKSDNYSTSGVNDPTKLVLAGGTATESGSFSGTGAVEKQGAGELILTGINTYSGITTVSGGTLRIGNGSGSSALSSTTSFAVSSGAILAFNMTNLTPFGGAIVNNGTVADMHDVSSLTLVGISGSGGFIKSGVGTTILSGSSSYTGATAVNAGTLQIGSGGFTGSFSSSAVTVASGATLAINTSSFSGFSTAIANSGTVKGVQDASTTSTIDGVISGTGGFTQTGAGKTILAGSNTYTGATSVAAGTLQIGGTFGGSISGSGAVSVAPGATLAVALGGPFALSNAIANSGTVTGVPSGSAKISGVISGSGIFRQNSAGTTTLSGANTYNGATFVDAGTLQIGDGAHGSLGNTSVTVASGATLAFRLGATSTFDANVANSGIVESRSIPATTIGSVISGTGSFKQAGSGRTILIDSNTYTGATTVSTGILQIGNGTSGSISGTSAVTVDTGAKLDVKLADNGTFSNAIANNGTVAGIADSSKTNTLSGVISGTGSFVQSGSGNTILTAANTYTGGTTVSAGRLTAGHNGEFGTFQAGSTVTVTSNGTLVATASDSLGWGIGNAKLAVVGGTVTTDGATGQHTSLQDVAMTGGRLTSPASDGRFLLNGPLVTSASATSAIIDAPLLDLYPGWTFGVTTSFTVADGAATDDLVISSRVTGPGPLIKVGAGSLVLSGTNTYAGATTVNAGKLVVDGSITSATTINSTGTLGGSGTLGAVTVNTGGTISPGNSPGTMNTGAETWNGGGGYVWEMNNASDAEGAKGVSYDWLNIGGTLNITATSEMKFTIYVTSLTAGNVAGVTPGFTYGTTYQWIIASGPSVTNFSADKFAINTSGFFANAANYGGFTITNIGNDLVLNYTAIPEPSTYAIGIAALFGVVILLRRRRV